jgi:sec-independent protein translocase protein TatA
MSATSTMMFFSGIGHWELIVVLFVVLLVFGAKVPEVMRSLGKGVTQFKKGIRDVEDEIMTESLPDKADKADKADKPVHNAGENVSADTGSEKKTDSTV